MNHSIYVGQMNFNDFKKFICDFDKTDMAIDTAVIRKTCDVAGCLKLNVTLDCSEASNTKQLDISFERGYLKHHGWNKIFEPVEEIIEGGKLQTRVCQRLRELDVALEQFIAQMTGREIWDLGARDCCLIINKIQKIPILKQMMLSVMENE